MAEHYYDIPDACFVDNPVLCNNLQDFLDDIHSRLQSLEQGGGTGDLGDRLTRLEKMHKENKMISGLHTHSGWTKR